MSDHDHTAHMMMNSSGGENMSGMPDMIMAHSDHANTNHHMDHGSMGHGHGAKAVMDTAGACSGASHHAHGMSVSYYSSSFFLLQ